MNRSDTLSSLLDVVTEDPRIEPVAAALSAGTPRFLGGLWGSSAPIVAGILAARVRRRAVLVTATLAQARDALDDLTSFGLEGEAPILLPPLRTAERSDAGFDPQAFSDRQTVLRDLFMNPHPRIVIAPIRALFGPIVRRDRYEASLIRIRPGETLVGDDLVRMLVDREFIRVPRVEAPGEVALRGDVVDIYPWGAQNPIRIELFDDEVEEIREFDPSTQRSTSPVLMVRFPAVKATDFRVTGTAAARAFLGYLPPASLLFLHEVERLVEEVAGERGAEKAVFGGETDSIRVRLASMPLPAGAGIINFKTTSVEPIRQSSMTSDASVDLLKRLLARNDAIHLFFPNAADRERFERFVETAAPELRERLTIESGRVATGFQWREAKVAVVSHRELMARDRTETRRVRGRSGKIQSAPILDFLELKAGDYVVHATHGIGRYRGIERLERSGVTEEFLLVEYRDDALLYVPAAKIELVQKYVGGSDDGPKLHRLGGTRWRKMKDQVELAVLDMASELLDLQATRERAPGFAFPADDTMQGEFEAQFPYVETPDQLEAIRAVKADMESPRPMDRLICGDVGFGKTEVALRAVFKAVTAGKQVGVLVPTTVLAQQHFKTFSERVADFPVTVEVLSRFRTPKQQKEIVAQTAAGRVDVLIGTHRIVSDDVGFRDLGLVIVDEEQRFGVEHKKFFKRLRATVDVLTLSATPIPRTLHLSLIKVKDISSLRTPPPGRRRIRTEVLPWDQNLIRKVLLRELDRGGQAYFLHNRVKSIDHITRKLKKLVPEARYGIVHGQMSGNDIEEQMLAFVERDVDVLVCTTIIESGLDIKNANTLIINEADRLGLSEMHQLRGRVGRHDVQAYAYLMPQAGVRLNDDARRRLKAIEEFSDLGAGFQLSMRDLEIRGAGNILGAEQHGHIAAVGYEMYCRLLRSAVKRFQSNEVEPPQPDVDMNLKVPAFVEDDYVGLDDKVKMEVLRMLGGVRNEADRDECLASLRDRFGQPSPEVWALGELSRVQHGAAALGISAIARSMEVDGVLMTFRTEILMTNFLKNSGGRAKFLKDLTLFARYPDRASDPEAFLDFVMGLLKTAGARI